MRREMHDRNAGITTYKMDNHHQVIGGGVTSPYRGNGGVEPVLEDDAAERARRQLYQRDIGGYEPALQRMSEASQAGSQVPMISQQ